MVNKLFSTLLFVFSVVQMVFVEKCMKGMHPNINTDDAIDEIKIICHAYYISV